MRCAVDDVAALEKLLDLFFGYERAEIAEFRKAVEQFKTDLPAVLEALRAMIERAHEREPRVSARRRQDFLEHAQEAINPSLTEADVREMLIQHILTEEIFAKVFDDTTSTATTTSPRELYELEATFFTGDAQEADAARAWSPTTPPSAPPPRRSAATTKSRPSSRSSTRTSTRSTTPRPPTGWAWSTRRTRSSAS